METETKKMTCDDFIAALRREDFTPDDLMNIARWAKREEARLSKKGIVGARTGDTLLMTEGGETARVTLEKVNRTKAEIVTLEPIGKWGADSHLSVPLSFLSRPTD